MPSSRITQLQRAAAITTTTARAAAGTVHLEFASLKLHRTPVAYFHLNGTNGNGNRAWKLEKGYEIWSVGYGNRPPRPLKTKSFCANEQERAADQQATPTPRAILWPVKDKETHFVACKN